jgi:AraC family transcriptional regulator
MLNFTFMYLTALPNHSAPGFDEKAHFGRFGRHNMIYNAVSGESQCGKHVGCLSLKTVFSGEEWYCVDGRRIAVRPGQFLVLNDDQTYSSCIPKGRSTHDVSVFFQKEFAASAYRDLLFKEETLLDDPFEQPQKNPEFFQTLNAVKPGLASHLTSLIAQLDTFGDDPDLIDEGLVVLLHYLLHAHRTDNRLVQKVNAVKPGTKKEIYRRLCIARDILHSSFQESIGLAELSTRVCLSRPQLIRQFKLVFGRTPYQYLIDIRLRHAAEALRKSPTPINEITWHCGFNDPSAFCRAFRSVYGASPEQFRSRTRHQQAAHSSPPAAPSI